jgi:hypothetical protein
MMQTSSNLIRWSGLAAMLGGALWVVKGGLILAGVIDLGELLIVAQLLFAVGLIGLHSRLAGRGGRLGRIGGFLAYAAAALSVVNAPYSVFFAEDGPQTPFPFNVTYAIAALAIFVGLVLLGLATLRAEILPRRWRALPLAIGLLALLPVWVLAFVHLELPVVVLGLAWMLLGYVLWSDKGAPVRPTAPVR